MLSSAQNQGPALKQPLNCSVHYATSVARLQKYLQCFHQDEMYREHREGVPMLSHWIRIITLYTAEVFSVLVVLMMLTRSPDSKAPRLHFALQLSISSEMLIISRLSSLTADQVQQWGVCRHNPIITTDARFVGEKTFIINPLSKAIEEFTCTVKVQLQSNFLKKLS